MHIYKVSKIFNKFFFFLREYKPVVFNIYEEREKDNLLEEVDIFEKKIKKFKEEEKARLNNLLVRLK